MTRIAIIGLVLSSLTMALSTASWADEKTAQKHLDRAIEYYQYGRYESAALEFERAYGQHAQPKTLFAWAQAERLAGRCMKSIELYQKFLNTEPPEQDVEVAEDGILECKSKLEAERAARQEAAERVAKEKAERAAKEKAARAERNLNSGNRDNEGNTTRDGQPVGETPDELGSATGPSPRDGPSPWYADRLGVALTGGGGVLLVASLGLYLSARSLANSASEDAADVTAFDSIIGRAKSRRNLAVLAAVLGAGATGLGIWRYSKVRAKSERSLTVAPAVAPGEASIVLYGQF